MLCFQKAYWKNSCLWLNHPLLQCENNLAWNSYGIWFVDCPETNLLSRHKNVSEAELLGQSWPKLWYLSCPCWQLFDQLFVSFHKYLIDIGIVWWISQLFSKHWYHVVPVSYISIYSSHHSDYITVLYLKVLWHLFLSCHCGWKSSTLTLRGSRVSKGTYGQINILRQNCDGLKIFESMNNLNKVCLTACITLPHWFYQMYLDLPLTPNGRLGSRFWQAWINRTCKNTSTTPYYTSS